MRRISQPAICLIVFSGRSAAGDCRILVWALRRVVCNNRVTFRRAVLHVHRRISIRTFRFGLFCRHLWWPVRDNGLTVRSLNLVSNRRSRRPLHSRCRRSHIRLVRHWRMFAGCITPCTFGRCKRTLSIAAIVFTNSSPFFIFIIAAFGHIRGWFRQSTARNGRARCCCRRRRRRRSSC